MADKRKQGDDSERRPNAIDPGARERAAGASDSERGPEISGGESTDHWGDPLSNRREERDQRRGGAEPGNESLDA